MGPDRARLCGGRGKPVRGGGRGTLYATTQKVNLVDQLTCPTLDEVLGDKNFKDRFKQQGGFPRGNI